MKKEELKHELERIERRIQILRNCCRQTWASEEEIKHWKKGISEYIDEANLIKNLLLTPPPHDTPSQESVEEIICPVNL